MKKPDIIDLAVSGRYVPVVDRPPPPGESRWIRHNQKHRPTDMTETEWMRVRRLFPDQSHMAAARRNSIRDLMNAVIYRVQEGVPLRKLPLDMPPWGTVHSFEHWILRHNMWPEVARAIGRPTFYNNLPSAIHNTRMYFPESQPMPRQRSVSRFSSGPHNFSCVYTDIPPSMASEILAFGKQVPDCEIHDKGREEQSHVTVCYGIKTDDVEDVKCCFDGICCPLEVSLGKVCFFPANDSCDYDVLKVDVNSDDLVALNKRICSYLQVESDYEYCPHITIAYLRPGAAKKYDGYDAWVGRKFTSGYLRFCPSIGDASFIVLDGASTVRMSLDDVPEDFGGSMWLDTGDGSVFDRLSCLPGVLPAPKEVAVPKISRAEIVVASDGSGPEGEIPIPEVASFPGLPIVPAQEIRSGVKVLGRFVRF